MISEPQTASLFAREQFRMTRLQVYNWGTFSGLHDVPISERGFLFVGRSGAGKSTLLAGKQGGGLGFRDHWSASSSASV